MITIPSLIKIRRRKKVKRCIRNQALIIIIMKCVCDGGKFLFSQIVRKIKLKKFSQNGIKFSS